MRATTFTLVVQATPPGSAGSYSFTATERFHSNPPATLDVMSAPVTVICPTDGLGTMAVNPSTVAVASSGTFTFTYTAGSCAAGAGGVVGVTVPGGWTPPGTAAAAAGNLTSGALVSFTYGPVQASSTGPATFSAWQSAAGGPARIWPPARGHGDAAPGGRQLGIDFALDPSLRPRPSPRPRTQSPTQSLSSGAGSSRHGVLPGDVLADPAAVRQGVSRSPWWPAACRRAAWSCWPAWPGCWPPARGAGRALRRGRPGAGGGDVRAVPHAGPPPSVAVRDTGTRPALTVRIEPHAGATVTTIEEKRP